MKEQLIQWKREKGHTVREMGKRLGVSSSHICRVMQGKKGLGVSRQKRFKEVRRLEILIDQSPPDVGIVKYELDKLINEGVSYANNI